MRSDDVVENAWTRAGAQCEGERVLDSGLAGRCTAPLLWNARGKEHQKSAWDARQTSHPSLGGWEAVKGCTILCWDCFQQASGVLRVTKRTAAARPMSP